jgi:hypothetical protein
MQLETENTDVEGVNLVAGWQPQFGPEPVKGGEWPDSDTNSRLG